MKLSAFPILDRYQEQFGFVLDAELSRQLQLYRDLLIEWNQRFNLTRVTEPDEIEIRLFLDSLALAPLFRPFRHEARSIRVMDVGAGAGVPGLPLKLVLPEIELVMMEATAKKVVFLNEVIQALGLTNTEAIHGRAEEVGQDKAYRGRFDVVLARAVARLPALVELCMPFCRVGGRGFFPKGANIDEEIVDAQRAASLLGCTILGTERPDAEELGGTSIVVVQQKSPAPDRYPRRPGIPAKEPL